MNLRLLNTEIQEFIHSNLDSDITSLILKGTPFKDVHTKEIIEQIESKIKSEKKLPSWYNQAKIYYPNKLNIEQTSSEITADYKSSLIHGKSLIDLTGGFGVDSLYFSKVFDNVTHCEINAELSTIAAHNFNQLKIKNIQTINDNGIQYLKNSESKNDWIYVDPSRRHDSKGKVFFLKDCLPDLPTELETLLLHSNNIMVKTSPLLDISIGIAELKFVKEIHVVAVNNEVKELLWLLEKDFNSEIEIKTINIQPKTIQKFDFKHSDESFDNAQFNLPQQFLYEPNAAILKAGAFNSVSNKLKLLKLHPHSHLYTSEYWVEFPGRRFEIENIIPYNKKQLKQMGIAKANVTIRNFPESVDNIRKTLKINDGGSTYLFFTTNANNEKIVIVCSKIS